jgi:radical SAM superfamily enzyme YgiQ (UPF0313 family)
MAKKILLVRPSYDPRIVNLEDITGKLPFLAKKAFMVPLDLATVAALTPDDIELDLWDERVHGRLDVGTDLKKDYDLVGVTGYAAHFRRVKELGHIFRERAIPVVVGGPGVCAAPERYRDHFDVLFIGEGELIWPQFIQEWKAGSARREYRQVTKVDMSGSPVPRWANMAGDLRHYMVGGVQTTRGCPFDCEFCDVIYIFGRLQRHKSIDQVLEEVSAQERLGIPHIFLCDDNFYGSPKYYKELLKELISLNQSFAYPLSFNTQIDIRVAKDDEMLGLLADANMTSMLVGIESPNVDSLVETNARKNLKADVVEDVKTIQSYGIEVVGSMIVGFDHDDTTIFQRTFEFLQATSIPISNLNALRAMTGTKLWIRLLKEGRVVGFAADGTPDGVSEDDVPVSNITPKLMTRTELLSGLRGLVEQVRDWRNFEARVKGMISHVTRQPRVNRRVGHVGWKQRLGILKFLLFSTDREARTVAWRLLFYTRRHAPFMIPRVVKMIIQNHLWRAHVPFMREAIAEQIRLDAMKELQLRPVRPGFFVPETFKRPYRAVFPELYGRVHRGLADKTRTHDTLVEVVYDFLTRWGPTFERLEDHHRAFFQEICDRSVAKENGSDPAVPTLPESTGADEGRDDVADVRQNRLADEVLSSVEQELRGFRPATAAGEIRS